MPLAIEELAGIYPIPVLLAPLYLHILVVVPFEDLLL